MIKTLIAAVTAAASLFLALSTDALADRRVALVIGNSQYNYTGLSLTNPKNDAADVAGALRTLGFEVIEATNTSKRDFDMALAQFARRATDADSALFFYAGHAMQYQGRNYLMPVDAELEDEISVRYQMIAIDDVRAALDRAPGVRIMILDACRNNPLAEQFAQNMTGQHRSIGSVRGLARIDKTQGMVVAYSTAADEVAMDGQGRNSPYTVALLKRLQEPGLEIEMMFRRIAADVNAQTNGKQRPETYVSLLNEYYLNQADRTAWNAVKDSSDPAALRGFITRFPSSPLLGQAEARLQLVERTGFERPVAEAEAKATETKATETKARDDADELRRKLADAQQQILQNEAAERERRAQAEQQAQVQQQAQAQQQAPALVSRPSDRHSLKPTGWRTWKRSARWRPCSRRRPTFRRQSRRTRLWWRPSFLRTRRRWSARRSVNSSGSAATPAMLTAGSAPPPAPRPGATCPSLGGRAAMVRSQRSSSPSSSRTKRAHARRRRPRRPNGP